MTRRARRSGPESPPFVPPYPPSLTDRLMDWVRRQGIPYAATYLVLFALETLMLQGVAWADGGVPRYKVYPFAVLFPLWLWGPLAMMTYLDGVAEQALTEYRPLLGKVQGEVPRLRYELTNLPAPGVWISGLIWTGVYLALVSTSYQAAMREFHFKPLTFGLGWIIGLVTYAIGSVVYYHTFRQLRLVKSILDLPERVNLFQLDPLYAFARLTAQTGVCWLLLAGVTVSLFPVGLNNVIVVAQYAGQVLLALGALVLPVWSVHQRLVVEKRRLLAEVNLRVEQAIRGLHQALDRGALARVKQFDTALGGLASERAVITAIPTWPWRPDTLRGVFVALVLPVFIWLVQYLLGRMLT
jgi:hypothetical protein